MTESKKGRVILESEATKALNDMTKEAKDGQAFIKVTPSKFASAIINLFRKNYFEKHKEELAKEFFDRKAFLKDAITSSKSSDELTEKVAELFGSKKKKRTKKPKKKEGAEGVEQTAFVNPKPFDERVER